MAIEFDDVFVSEFDNSEVLELLKCKRSPAYFITKYVKVFDPSVGDIVPITLNKATTRMLARIHKNKKIIINASRQAGVTVINSAYMLWYAMFNRNRTLVIVGDRMDVPNKMLMEIRKMTSSLPIFIRPNLIKFTRSELVFENRCKIKATSLLNGTNSIRGYAISYLFIDNIDNIEIDTINLLYNNILPMISCVPYSKIVFSTNKNRCSSKHLDILKKIISSGFKLCNIPWHFIPGRDIAWKTRMVSLIGWDRFVKSYEIN